MGLPREPELILGKKFMFISAAVTNEHLTEEDFDPSYAEDEVLKLLDTEHTNQSYKPTELGNYQPYVLFGTVIGLDFLIETRVGSKPSGNFRIYISPNQTSLGSVTRMACYFDGGAMIHFDTTPKDAEYNKLHLSVEGRVKFL